VNFGFDVMATCITMVPFALFFHYAYDVSPYDLTKPRMLPISEMPPQYMGGSSDSQAGLGAATAFNEHRHLGTSTGGEYHGGFLGYKAWLTVLDPREIIRAIVFAFTMSSQAQKLQSQRGYQMGTYNK
jgi:hypothetical protein